MIVLDTTVLLYAHGAHHPLRGPCRELVVSVEQGRLAATTTAEVIQEFAHVRARRRDRMEAAQLARAYVGLLSPLLTVDREQLSAGLDLFERHPELGAFDAVLAAAAIDARADALVSADRGFSSIGDLVHVDPGTPAIRDLLGS